MRKLVISAFAISASITALLVWYQHGYAKYKSVFLPNTHINNIDVSSLSIDEAEEKIKQPLQDVTVQYLDNTVVISAKDLNATASYKADIQDAYGAQDHAWWFKALRQPSYFHASADINYDVSGLDGFIQEFPFVQKYTEPVDAKITYENGIFEIQKETVGTKPDTAKMAEEISASVQKGVYDIDVSDCLISPAVTTNDLSLTEQMKTLNARDAIEINVGGEGSCVLSKGDFQDIILWDGENISINDTQLSECVQNLSDTYSTFGKQRKFIAHNGDEVTVGGSVKDDFGYEINLEKTKENLSNAILNGEDSCEISWKQEGKTRSELNDFGTTYAEVNIAAQHVWYYKDGECVFESDTVTGLPALGGTTPGVFHILYKQSPSVLKGENYETPVTYWMPFTYTGTGFHDASWRSKFGGNLYLTTGSHGCVNLPAEKAAELFGLIQTGDPVIVY